MRAEAEKKTSLVLLTLQEQVETQNQQLQALIES